MREISLRLFEDGKSKCVLAGEYNGNENIGLSSEIHMVNSRSYETRTLQSLLGSVIDMAAASESKERAYHIDINVGEKQ